MMRRMRCQPPSVMTRRLLSSPRLPTTHAPSQYVVLPLAQVGQSYPPVGNQADADRRPELIADHHLGLMLLSGYILERDALDTREEGLHLREAGVVGHTLLDPLWFSCRR